ncbi:MAG: hypothetical protein QXU59_07805 [Pyrobaculum sp.]|jgi:hypothetical protein
MSECRSAGVVSLYEAARALYETYVKYQYYSPIDKLANASSPQNLLMALYEVVRGLGERSQALSRVVDAITNDLSKEECVEEALKLAKRLAVKALSEREGAAQPEGG